MAAVGAEDVVIGGQREGHPHRRRLLADGEMGGTGVVVGDAAVGALELDLVEDRLELPDRAHVPPDVQEVLGRVARPLLLHGLPVGVDRDVIEVDDVPEDSSCSGSITSGLVMIEFSYWTLRMASRSASDTVGCGKTISAAWREVSARFDQRGRRRR